MRARPGTQPAPRTDVTAPSVTAAPAYRPSRDPRWIVRGGSHGPNWWPWRHTRMG